MLTLLRNFTKPNVAAQKVSTLSLNSSYLILVSFSPICLTRNCVDNKSNYPTLTLFNIGAFFFISQITIGTIKFESLWALLSYCYKDVSMFCQILTRACAYISRLYIYIFHWRALFMLKIWSDPHYSAGFIPKVFDIRF